MFLRHPPSLEDPNTAHPLLQAHGQKRRRKRRYTSLALFLYLALVLPLGCMALPETPGTPAETPVESPGETPVETPQEPEYPITLFPVVKDPTSPKYQFRAAWLPSVRNLDFPAKPGMTAAELKEAFRKILDVYELYHLNAVILQVRPSGDALYPSALNPPSIYVTGTPEGALPFDLLEFAVTETHKRGMEFHAWFNPFRVTVEKSSAPTEEILQGLSSRNYARLHPETVLRFDDRLFLNPGLPEVQKFVQDSILEVVSKYDIDAVHLDDYFYPYRSTRQDENGQTVPYLFGDDAEDAETFAAYGEGFSDIKEWRRENTYRFIKSLSTAIKEQKPYVKLGISPFGIWGHAEETGGLGSNTPVTSSETYAHTVFIDTRRWVKEELIDYILPQIYWNIGETAAPYDTLSSWWAQVVEGTRVDLYIGHALYKVYENVNSPLWKGEEIMVQQLDYNKNLPAIRGSAFFSFRHLTPQHEEFKKNAAGKASLVKNTEALKEAFALPALVPVSAKVTPTDVPPPDNVHWENGTLSFQSGYTEFDELKKPQYFLVYQFPKEDVDPENPAYIYRKLAVDPQGLTYTVNQLDSTQYRYGVSAVNRLHEESPIALLPEEP